MTSTVDILDAEIVGIDEPGVYDLPAEVYHADPVQGGSLSSHGIRDLLPPSCPAIFRYKQTHPQAPKKEYDLGHAAHAIVLGTGATPVLVDRPRWDTNEVKARLAEIRAAGDVPLKRPEWEMVHAMADQIRAHRLAAALLDPGRGRAEQTHVWRDPETGVWCRAMYDYHGLTPTDLPVIVDYKTAESAHEMKFRKAAGDYGYDIQQGHYEDGYLELHGVLPLFFFVVQEKNPPYLVNVIQLEQDDIDRARQVCRAGRAKYAECLAADRWPGYGDDVTHVRLNRWTANTREEILNDD